MGGIISIVLTGFGVIGLLYVVGEWLDKRNREAERRDMEAMKKVANRDQ